jgi:molecular chaperone GrpE (heat shock protein)
MEDADELRRQVADLTDKLARKTAEADEYRRSMYALLDRALPYVRPTDEELHDMMHGPRGQSILEVIEEFERQSPDAEGDPHDAG